MKKLILASLLIVILNPFANATTDWELAKDEDGIKVYTRELDGWDVEEFKVISVFNVKRYLIFNVLMDVTNYQNWYPDIIESRITKTISEDEFYWYSKIDLPWPTEDRDGEAHVKVTHNKTEKTTLISMAACEKYVDRKSDAVRMTKGKGFWKLTSKDDGSTVVHYQYVSDPAGSIPTWIINMFIVDNPYNTVAKLREKAQG